MNHPSGQCEAVATARPAPERTSIADLDVASILRSPFQVRSLRDQEHIAALAQSIDDNELASPILVRPLLENDCYELVCGENRLEAHKLLGRAKIRAIIRPMTDAEAATLLSADNLQRKELSDWEICQTINMLNSNGFAKTDAAVSRILGRRRSFIAKVRAFNELPPAAASLVSTNPSLFGAALASDLRASGYCKKYPALVEEAFKKVVNGSLTQAGVISWVRSKTTPLQATALKDTTFTINNKKVRITIYPDTIRISCKGMDSLALEAGLQAALEKLM